MSAAPSGRILACVDALPLAAGLRVLEIGCGPGVAAREIARRVGDGFVLAIDRSGKAIDQAIAGSSAEIGSGRLAFRHVAAENLDLQPGEEEFDLAFAMRVGALDGRHPELGLKVLEKLKQALRPGGRLFIDGGAPLREIDLAAT